MSLKQTDLKHKAAQGESHSGGPPVRVRIRVHGIVQGVGFRPFVYRLAHDIGLVGSIRNRGDAGVEVLAAGTEEQVSSFLRDLRAKAPPHARIVKLDVQALAAPAPLTEPAGFRILPSESGGEGSGTIPPDVAICDDCLEDLRNATRYQGYWATSCTNCGARFTLVEELPYDRERTSMRDFPLCKGCESEYTNPLDRRYHAQATACEHCGPKLEFMQGSSGEAESRIPKPKPKVKNPDSPESSILNPQSAIRNAIASLKAGRILAIKGIGGSHLACNAASEEAVARLRSRRRRFFQPFAIMAREDMIPALAQASAEELESLRSWRRPIVVLKMAPNADLAPSVNPGMASVGVMLPYTGLHHLIFDRIDFPLVMTSANVPGLPMAIANDAILNDLEAIADDYLLHDRRIIARCDDSVVRFSGGGARLIRRSRGWAPAPVDIDLGPEPILALGAELQNAVALYTDGKCYLSQFIGDVDKLETLDYLKAALDHLLALTGQKMPKLIACDLHPQFLTTQFAEELVGGSPERRLIQVQHHHAHIASVMGEQGLDRCVGIAADGIGYGSDGRIWGGEVLLAERAGFTKLGGLANVAMPGGDSATRYPARMVAAFLAASGLPGGALRQALDAHVRFVRGKAEREVVLRQLETGTNTLATSSAGRFLDAASALLGLCDERTYEGEPAMRLEACAVGGRAQLIPPAFQEWRDSSSPIARPIKTLDTPHHFLDLLEMKEQGTCAEDIAATAQQILAQGLAELAIGFAKERGISDICLSGGVAYNDAIATAIRRRIETEELSFHANEAVPCGDGGIAFGQCVAAAAQLGATAAAGSDRAP